jgi:hypothetical protein
MNSRAARLPGVDLLIQQAQGNPAIARIVGGIAALVIAVLTGTALLGPANQPGADEPRPQYAIRAPTGGTSPATPPPPGPTLSPMPSPTKLAGDSAPTGPSAGSSAGAGTSAGEGSIAGEGSNASQVSRYSLRSPGMTFVAANGCLSAVQQRPVSCARSPPAASVYPGVVKLLRPGGRLVGTV